MKSKLTILIIAFCFVLIPPTVTYAQSDSSSSSFESSSSSSLKSSGITQSQVLNVTIQKLTQSALDKTQPVKITIVSTIDTDRLEVAFDYDKDNLELQSSDSKFYNVKKEEPLELIYNFKAKRESDNRVFARVQAWQNEANYPELKSVDLNFDKNLEIIPQTKEYTDSLNILNTFRFFIALSISTVLLFFLFKLTKKFLKWYEKD